MPKKNHALDASSLTLVDTCCEASLALLESNLTPHGILAASPTPQAVARRYTRIFGRDAAICVMAMCGSGVPALEEGAVASLDALAAHLRGESPRKDLPLDVQATAFQMKVWQYLQREIAPGSVQSYAEVAQGIGSPKAVRAVANACASNRVAIAIPCHRVIRGTGELGGYKWGVERKRVLLDLERRAAANRRRSEI